MGRCEKDARRSLKSLEPCPILRTELHFKMQLVPFGMLLDHFATSMQPGDPRPITGVEKYLMGL